MRPPDYTGGGLVNVAAELERRLSGAAPSPGLRDDLAAHIPAADSYVLVMFDGLGVHQLDHPNAGSLAASLRGQVDASFPTTTTVSLATLATGIPPAGHGLLGYQLWLPETGKVMATIKWTSVRGERVACDYDGFLPETTWERLAAAGAEPIALQPIDFEGSALTRVLYRGARFEGYHDMVDAADAAASLAAPPGRLVVLYVPQVDFAAHVAGQQSEMYAEAMAVAAATWDRLIQRLPAGAVAIGVADHGHVDVPPERRTVIERVDHKGRNFAGDARVVFVHGEGESLAERLPATWISRSDMESWWGPGPRHPAFDERAPDGVLVVDPGHAVLHRFSDDRLVGQHGGLTPEELDVPLLVAGSARL
ncbi:MAG: alkaline phosphatase family protein [Acidimicrobiia bacterium]|nr:alkaline phosphatase family protein [Acidimicrobiia bacterium]